METNQTGDGRGVAAFRRRAEEIARAAEPERRHEVLLDQAVARDRLDPAQAEAVYELALEENLEPEFGLLLAATGVGVVELEALATDPERLGIQQSPPGWVADAGIPPVEARRERRLRLSFRRLRGLLEESGSAAEALRRFANEPDVAEDAY